MKKINETVKNLDLHELKFFQAKFDEYQEETGDLSFESFRDIVMASRKFNSSTIALSLDKLKRNLLQSSPINIDGQLLSITKEEYFNFLDCFAKEQDKIKNEKDPELRSLFNLLSYDEPILKRKKLVNVIQEFELPINVEEFLIPLGKKEDITYPDFCSLFKSKSYPNDILLSTFTSSFYNSHDNEYIQKVNAESFPIKVIPK